MFSFKDLLTTLCSVLLALCVTVSSVAADDAATSETETAAGSSHKSSNKSNKPDQTAKKASVDERDFYTRRAQELLDADHAEDSKVHPLAKNYPDQFVVVCTGGCKNRQAQIVDFEPRKRKIETEVGEMIPTAAGSASDVSVQVISCLAGCRGDNSVYFATGGDMDADWDSTSAPAGSGVKTESGRWLSDQN